jgi:hypothetical protein
LLGSYYNPESRHSQPVGTLSDSRLRTH